MVIKPPEVGGGLRTEKNSGWYWTMRAVLLSVLVTEIILLLVKCILYLKKKAKKYSKEKIFKKRKERIHRNVVMVRSEITIINSTLYFQVIYHYNKAQFSLFSYHHLLILTNCYYDYYIIKVWKGTYLV